jgi:hypothetical protein
VAESPLFELQRYGRGVIYPTTKELVIQWAQHNGAPQDVLDRLDTLPQRVAGPHETLYALRRLAPCAGIQHPSSGTHATYNWGQSGVGAEGVPQDTYKPHQHSWRR